jgi:hypothetical protein
VKNYFFVLVSCALISLTTARADNTCPDVRLDQQGAMVHVPVTFQGQVGICYAHAAAQMIDAYRFSHSAPEGDTHYEHLTSPLELASQFMASSDPKSDFDDGTYAVCPVVNYLRDHESCDENSVAKLYQNGIRINLVNDLRKPYLDFQKYLKTSKLQAASVTLQNLDTVLTQDLSEFQNQLSQLADPSIQTSLPTEAEALQMLLQPNFNLAMNALLAPFCTSSFMQTISAGISCSENQVKAGSITMPQVHALLTLENAQPVAVKICSNFFNEGHAYRGKDFQGNMIKTGKEACDIHWVLLIGQTMYNGQCRLLVRNSWGTDDSGYSTDWLPRESGNLWIDEETLSANTFEFASINPK